METCEQGKIYCKFIYVHFYKKISSMKLFLSENIMYLYILMRNLKYVFPFILTS